MHIHQVKVPSRKSFRSLLDICKEMWDEVKVFDEHLPMWGRLNSTQTVQRKEETVAGLTELREDGKIPNTEFSVIGVRVGVAVQYIKDAPPMRCNVVDMSDDTAITIEKVVAEEETTGKSINPQSR